MTIKDVLTLKDNLKRDDFEFFFENHDDEAIQQMALFKINYNYCKDNASFIEKVSSVLDIDFFYDLEQEMFNELQDYYEDEGEFAQAKEEMYERLNELKTTKCVDLVDFDFYIYNSLKSYFFDILKDCYDEKFYGYMFSQDNQTLYIIKWN